MAAAQQQQQADLDNPEVPWELFYWAAVKEDGKNHMIGRGEFVRLIFEAAGVSYIDHGVLAGAHPNVYPKTVADFIFGDGNKDGFPVLAPPAIRKGRFVVNQTPTILRFLGTRLGLAPRTEVDQVHADSVMSFLTDFIAEGRLVFHPKCFTQSYYEQVEEAKPYIKWFEDVRMPRFLSYLQKVLQYNSPHLHVVGEELTYVDIGLFHVLDAAKSQFPEAYDKCVATCPLLPQFYDAIKALPRIASYLASDRRGLFEGNSMM
jgi:glutathione S-transferase